MLGPLAARGDLPSRPHGEDVAARHVLHRHVLLHVPEPQGERPARPRVEPPAVAGVPGRRRGRPAAARRRGPLALELGQGGEEPGLLGRLAPRREEELLLALDEGGVEVGAREGRRGDEPRQELDVVRDAHDPELREGGLHARQGQLARRVPDDQLRDHRVVPGRDLVALLDARVDPDVVRGLGLREVEEPPGRRQEPLVRVLGVDPGLEGVAVDPELLLGERERLAGRDPELPLDEVEPGDHLGDRVLDLQPGVHLHEEEGAGGVDDELHRAGADVADRPRRLHRRPAHGGAPLGRHARRGRLLEHLLVAALHRAVALEEVHAVAVPVARRPGSPRGGAGARSARRGPGRRRRPGPPRAGRRSGLRRSPPARPPGACPCRRRRRSP